ncbi:MAG: peptide chain release factor 1 [Hyphomicrobiales bacterium]|nr:peptide chain release factor 1 [Hyphomicrobiales bacterium]
MAAALAAGPAPADYPALAREFADGRPLAEAIRALRAKEKEAAELAAMADDAFLDPEMRAMAGAERTLAAETAERLGREVRIALLPTDSADEGGIILEIRAGTGGDEAALFAADLYRMYSRYAQRRGWRVEEISRSEGALGGLKEVVAEVSGAGVYGRLRHESGVHRVQRVPRTESQGRIHTSAATVAVLPEAGEVDVRLDDADLRVETMRAGGAGGQHVNKTESAVRITHLPSGLAVVAQDERSQHRNRAKALAVLRARLLDSRRASADAERAADRRAQVGGGDRSERIRTYNFPQGRITDHRIGLTLHTLDRVIEGDGLDEILDALAADRRARLLAERDGA